MSKNFKELGLSEELTAALKKQGIEKPTEVQENTMYQSLAYHQHETVREILCDKYGIEGDDVDEMIDEIICGLNNLKIF